MALATKHFAIAKILKSRCKVKKATGGASPKKAKASKSAKVPQTKFVSLAETFELCGGEEHTLTLLREGTLQARGRSGTVAPRDQYYRDGNIENIHMECWRDYFLSENKEHLSDGEESYITAIEIERARIDELLNAAPGAGYQRNRGGRPEEYDWEGAWPHVLVDIQENGFPNSVNEWAERISDFDCWGVKKPNDSTVKNRWREVLGRAVSLFKERNHTTDC